MKKFFGALVAASALMSVVSSANAESIGEYRNVRMEAVCAQTYYGAKWVGVGTSAITVPILGSLIPALMTEDCDQWNMRKAAAELARFQRRYPGLVKKYNASVGVSASVAQSSWGPLEAFGRLNVAGN